MDAFRGKVETDDFVAVVAADGVGDVPEGNGRIGRVESVRVRYLCEGLIRFGLGIIDGLIRSDTGIGDEEVRKMDQEGILIPVFDRLNKLAVFEI